MKVALIHQRAVFLITLKIDSLSDWRGYLNLIQDKDTLVTKLSTMAGIFVLVASFSLLILSIPYLTVSTSSVQVVSFSEEEKTNFLLCSHR